MTLRWLAPVCFCTLVIATAHSAVVPSTEQTLLVTTNTDDSSTGSITEKRLVSSEPVPSSVSPEPTTEHPLPPLKMTEMNVHSEVSLRYAQTAIVTTVRNPADRAQEATFRVLLPETAFISGFTMTLGGKSYKAYVKEKEAAKQIYSEAVSQGFGAAHIAAKARDSNHFTVSVNVEAHSTALFNLTYEELLVRRNNVYNLAMNLHPGAQVPKMTVTVHIKEAQKITTLRVPEIRTGNEIDATEQDALNTKAVIVRGHDDREATITFSPDLEEQKRLMDVYAEKSKESQNRGWTYGSQSYDESERKIDGVLGQFVVQYDVDRPKGGEILVNDGYFVHFFAPSSLPPLAKHVVFVLDTSGSMSGRKIIQLQQAMSTILDELNKGDYFSIVEFASSVTVHDLKEADEAPKTPQYGYYSWDYEKPTTLLPPSPASKENVEKAKVIVSRMSANGGTNIASALNVAADLIHKGVDWKPEPSLVTTPSSNQPAIDKIDPVVDEPIALPVAKSLNASQPEDKTNTEVGHTENNENEQKAEEKHLEPIIIFLTDGEPTVGEINPILIANRISEKNSGYNKASIFSLAFGEDADRSFLRKLSLRNEGFMRHIYEAADAALQLRDFYRLVSSPLLADVHFAYPPDQVKEDSLTKHKFRTYYAGSETVVAGRVADSAVELAPEVVAWCGVDDSFTKKKYKIFPKVPILRDEGTYLPLERLWAYLTTKQLLDQHDAADQSTKKEQDSPDKKALAIALKYEFVTPLTSLVVVKPNATNAVDAESVDKPNEGYGPMAIPHAFHSGNPTAFYASNAAVASGGFSGPSPVLLYQLQPLAVDALLLDDQNTESEYEELDSFDHVEAVSTPIIVRQESTTLKSQSTLASYYLEHYPWVSELLNNAANDSLRFTETKQQAGGSVSQAIDLELSKSVNAPKDADGDKECAKATDGAAGLCVYLTRCHAARNITATDYSNVYCTVDKKYAGVCCPRGQIDLNISD